ncbi:protein-tyrosine-phosphatase [Pontibacter sp. 13R65]|uniref:protein-tyrosine-phosphatase n=1 Tax=Pontibacter sp. 13R65 TaxID=3127458 RepID=UPI00301E129B
MDLYPTLQHTIAKALELPVTKERQAVLQELVSFIQQKKDAGQPVLLNFICTHNSRRSQFSQIWAQTAAAIKDVEVRCFSGGVEVTAFNDRAIAATARAGFMVSQEGEENPIVEVKYSKDATPIIAFSKVFDDAANPAKGFAAVMTCSHADENCPYIAGAEARIPVRYEDPKAFDGTAEEAAKYDERSLQIASEMLYVFSKIL